MKLKELSIGEEAQHTMVVRDCWRCCLNCEHFSRKTETCFKFGQRPPAEVIVHGCAAHEPSIPF